MTATRLAVNLFLLLADFILAQAAMVIMVRGAENTIFADSAFFWPPFLVTMIMGLSAYIGKEVYKTIQELK